MNEEIKSEQMLTGGGKSQRLTRKAHVITLQNVRNYGSVLQALATQEVLERHGLEVWFYNYFKNGKDNGILARAKGYTKQDGMVGKIVKAAMLVPTFIRQDRLFDDFLKQHLHTLPTPVCTEEDFKQLTLDADVYVTGSDQTWNSGWNNGILPPLFLSFAPADKPLIAYAASFGKAKLDEWEREETRQRLSRYKAISVRESSAVDIIDDLDIGIKAVHVLDPTLQVSGDYWRQKLSHPVGHERYCLVYQLNHNAEFDRFAMEFAHRKGLKLIRWCNRYDQMRLPADVKLAVPEVSDFVSYIDHADFVLTDSFHCTAFSHNLGKQFLSVLPNEFGGRIGSLLKLTHLEHRRVKDLGDMTVCDMPDIDYAPVNDILERERKVADDFLTKALAGV